MENNNENINNENTEEPQAQERDYEAELASMKDQLLRALAESDNIRKRSQNQIEDAAKFAISGFARDLINVMENLYRATESVKQEDVDSIPALQDLLKGVELTKKDLQAAFAKNKVKRIEPEIGGMFDHNLHQAVAHVPDETKAKDTILSVLQAGYVINDRLLTPAMVVVAREASA